MADQGDLSEAYHVLGQLHDGLRESENELRQLREKANQEHQDLLKQRAEAEQHGDQAAIERCDQLIAQAQQAWIVANQELGDDQDDDQTPPEEDNDGDGLGEDGGSPAGPLGN